MKLVSEMQASEDLATFFAVSIDMLCIRDMDGRFVKLSQSWETVLGYPVAELLDRPLLPLVHPDDELATRAQMERINSDGEIVGFINRYRHRDGRYRHLEWRAKLCGDRVFAVARDVTDRLAAEAAMQAAKEAAEAANRAKSDFLANMSHEIRTPLNGVIGVVAALAQTELTARQRDMLDLVQTSGMTLERLVSDILDVSKIEAGQLEIEARPFDLRDELGVVLRVNEMRALEKGLGFRVDYDDEARGEFLGDATRLKQVLGNLMSNAVKFTHRGEVRLTVGVSGSGAAESVLHLEVRDTGVGFDPAAAASLFQRFSQADATITRRFGGTGLGLSICKSIVEMMGGEITAEASPGQGSRFRVSVPLPRTQSLADYDRAQRDELMLRGRNAPEEAPVRVDALRVLLAEDHPINQRVVQLILEPLGAQITTVENGQAAVEAFERASFDLVLMDMQMPVMDGLTATAAIRQYEASRPAAARTPILMLSANAMAQHREQALAAGADNHVPKPITAASLMDGILTALDDAAELAAKPA